MTFPSADFWSAFEEAGFLDSAQYLPEAGAPVDFLVSFERPDQIVVDGVIQSTEYEIEYQAADAPLKKGAKLVIGGVTYRVRQPPQARGDGTFCRALLERISL